ncbi:hypothetical protein ASPWEDRAFT_235189 [Aspergillus wentii DTO 134E9]|uniref:Uncharacterized protein n=1 Tax=Aspergillus wentii DTO 134E9 TaxID=1073089 RepID=A0A1L9S0Y1_ASPWE|nr:uncharacterized protein ASPWEDRAFT_235189 [Aspergillus wentii DTO 134E9]OJJ40825.1 hypothetical protein ASPWEDRAFT_235189 [Aspergillus wentii DTO 134E9]
MAPALSQNVSLLIFSYIVPTSYFDQIIFGNSVDIGISMTTLHWLHSEHPGIGHYYLPLPDAALKDADADLSTFLEKISHEQ